MRIDLKTARFLANVLEAMENGQFIPAPLICPECGESAENGEFFREASHILIEQREGDELADYVLIGCEGYITVNPNDFGMNSPGWAEYRA